MLRVLTLNIWGINEWEARRDSIVAWVDELQPDLIALQEVDRRDGYSQADWIAARVGMESIFVPGFTRGERQFGNAVLTRLPIVAERGAQLPGGGRGIEPRAILSVDVETSAGPLTFSSTHLSHRPEEAWLREEQAVVIAQFLDDRPTELPPVLCGDMNATAESTALQFLTGQLTVDGQRGELIDAYDHLHPGDGAVTRTSRNPYAPGARHPKRIDFVLVGPPRADGVGRVMSSAITCDGPRLHRWPSDHFGVLADLDYP